MSSSTVFTLRKMTKCRRFESQISTYFSFAYSHLAYSINRGLDRTRTVQDKTHLVFSDFQNLLEKFLKYHYATPALLNCCIFEHENCAYFLNTLT